MVIALQGGMMRKKGKKTRCSDPKLRKLVKEGLTGALTKPSRVFDLRLAERHIRECEACLWYILHHADVKVTSPFRRKWRKDHPPILFRKK